MVLYLSINNKSKKKKSENMKKFGLTLLTAFVGGAMALGAYNVFEVK
jgi:serine protease Do